MASCPLVRGRSLEARRQLNLRKPHQIGFALILGKLALSATVPAIVTGMFFSLEYPAAPLRATN